MSRKVSVYEVEEHLPNPYPSNSGYGLGRCSSTS